MSKNGGYQPTLQALFNRKRKLDSKEQATASTSRDDVRVTRSAHKRWSSSLVGSPEVITLDTPGPEARPDTPDGSPSPPEDLTEATFGRFRELTCLGNENARPCPIPRVKWAERGTLWESFTAQDAASKQQRGDTMFSRNPQVQPRMRSILLDWLIEVSDVYKLHRETYYLAQDYVDRVLLIQENFPKQDLQLLGITCLFLAAKVEEIYPPKVAEFAYVTDGACTDTQILDYEMVVVKSLDWHMCRLTAAGWLRLYLQVASQRKAQRSCKNDFEIPRFPSASLPLVSKLLDLATMDAGCVRFSYSHLAAAALALTYGRFLSTDTACLEWKELRPCVHWMAPFAVAMTSKSNTGSITVADSDSPLDNLDDELRLRPELRALTTLCINDMHNLQNHCVSMELLDIAQALHNDQLEGEARKAKDLQTPSNKAAIATVETPEGLLTPPASRGKVLNDVTAKTTNTSVGLKPMELFASPSSPSSSP